MLHHPSATNNSTIGRAKLSQRVFSALSLTAPWLAVRVAERLFVTPLRVSRPPREHEWSQGAERFSISSPYGPLAAWSWGAGPRTVLLMHGWAGRGTQLGAFVAPLLAEGYRVVAYDAPGHGESPGRTSNLLILTKTAQVVARSLGPLQGIVAHSIGAAAAMLALGNRKLVAQRAVTLAPAARMATVVQSFGYATGFSPAVLERIRDRFETRLHFRWSQIEPLQHAADLQVPLLVIHDLDDKEMPWTEGVGLAHAYQGELLLTSGLGHRRLLRDPGVISSAVSFLTS
jgi:pimeloyl-ACP methyl ester carboxylesterase